MEIHSHAYAAAEEVGRKGGVGRKGDYGGVVGGGGTALDPLFGEGASGEKEGTHVSEEEDVHVEVDAAVEVEDDEADSVGDLDGSDGSYGGRDGEVGVIVGVEEKFRGDEGFVIRSRMMRIDV